MSISATTVWNFYPCRNVILIVSLILIGAIILLIKKKRDAYIIITPVIILLILSYFEIYPFLGRVILFIIPISLICYCAPLLIINKNKKLLSFVISFIFVFANLGYIIKYPQLITKPNIWLREELRTLYEYLEIRLKPNDIIFTANDMYQQNKMHK